MLDPNTQMAKADTLLPMFDDDNKRSYLVYRITGFSRKESLQRSGLQAATVREWIKKDSAFAEIEGKGIMALGKEYRDEIINLEFARNFKLATEKDREIFDKSLDASYTMTDQEWDYLKKIRPMYSPQGYKILKDIIGETKGLNGWSEVLILARSGSYADERVYDRNEPSEFIDQTASWTEEHP